jgi:hypothetical protein
VASTHMWRFIPKKSGVLEYVQMRDETVTST